MIKFANPDIIAAASKDYATKQDTESLTKVLEAVSTILKEEGEVFIPVLVEQDGSMSLETLLNEKRETFVLCCTSQFQARAAGYETTINRRLSDYIDMVMQLDAAAGICVNPGDDYPFTMQKLMLQALLAESQKAPYSNGIKLFKGDITTMDVDCIVNAANNELLGGGGVDGAIHRAAGPDLLAECKILMGCPTGQAKITNGYNLPAKFVIHTVGPVYNLNSEDPRHMQERSELGSCYRSSLEVAKLYHIHSIAFPCISCGSYGYPIEEATKIAFIEVVQWLNENPNYGMQVTFVCYDDEAMDVYKSIIDNAQHPDPDAPNFMSLLTGLGKDLPKQ
ncbi:MAG: O-acetyl-ADP-ribose deacetylase [Phascolarctobacterium sp.]|nr:O-acetyl-ADP-ribose deacetylase [Phascolarctobacterium sp.]